MGTNRLQWARAAFTGLLSVAACMALMGAPLTFAQAPVAPGGAAQAPSPEELEQLVGPIALYPDDLVAIILPASTNPLQIVQADRFLEKRKQDPKLPVDDRWDDSVKALVNYPEVVRQMSGDLDWTAALGEAVVADQGAVLDAVQAFRRKAQAAGNLKTDDKQVVEVDKEVIQIIPADPQIIYVPQYNPAAVVVYTSAPVYGYYPAPYPVYYYPYPPGAAFATGLIWGAAIGAAWRGGAWGCNWSGGTINNNVTINRGNVNVNRPGGGNVNRPGGGAGNRPSQQPGGGSAWKPNKQPGQVAGGVGRPSTGGRVGYAGPAGGGAVSRPSQQPGGVGARPSQQPGGAGARPSQQPGGAGARPSQQAGGGGMGQAGNRQQGAGLSAMQNQNRASAGGANRDAFSGYGSGRQTSMDSSRGAASRNSMQGGARPAGGGARPGGGAGGGGGGGGRGGGRR
jgi:hypothetical protein